MNSIKNLLQFLNENWTSLVIIFSLAISLAYKIRTYANQSNEEKLNTAKKQISEIMLKLITDAEVAYSEWTKAGSIKRSQVIKKIYSDYPILSKVADQDKLIKWIDEQINEALKTLREINELNGRAG